MSDGFARPTSLSNKHDPEYQTEVKDLTYTPPSAQLEKSEFWGIVKKALTKAQYAAIECIAIDGLTQDQAAKKLGISQRGMGLCYARAIKRLARLGPKLQDHLPTVPRFRAGHAHARASDVAITQKMESRCSSNVAGAAIR